MKTPTEMLREARMLEVARELRATFGAKLVAIRDRDGNLHGRAELLDDIELPPEQDLPKPQPYRGKGR